MIVVVYGALLRLDALTFTYGTVDRPEWLRSLQASRLHDSVLRPSGFQWQRWEGRYISDPYTYLQYARDGHSFFAAHRREPVFPFATRLSLWLLHDQDIAVSFASMFFSVLAIAGTFLLGYAAFSYWVGLGAAAAVAIEYNMVTQGIIGWRDDAFTCAVVFTALTLLRYDRFPSVGNAAAGGLSAGLSCLVRITSLSFVIPGIAWVVATGGQAISDRLRHAAIIVVVAAAITGPYVFNCWRTFGDPLYAINIHADIYRATEGQTVSNQRQTASQYIRAMFQTRPWETIDTAVLGMTMYPFTNKWDGFDGWHPVVGKVLSWASLAGLFLFLGSREGQLLLIVLVSSLVPYMLTWKLIADWRFTEHTYPFFLTAAFFAVYRTVQMIAGMRSKSLASLRADLRTRAALQWTVLLIALAAVVWFTVRILPVAVATEELRRNESVSVNAGGRQGAFFRDGWSDPETEGSVTARISTHPRATVWLPLADRRGYRLTIRMDPFPRPVDLHQLPGVGIYLNDQLLQNVDLGWDPERVGAYDVDVPREIVSSGNNLLELRPVSKTRMAARIRLWYVRIHPGQP